MTVKTKFKSLKSLNLQSNYVSLAVIKEYKKQRISQYDVKYVQIDKPLEARLKGIILHKIENAKSFEEYTFDCPEPEEDLLRTIDSDSTDFNRIMAILDELNPEEDIIESLDELVKAKSYMIILRNDTGIQVIGFKTIPENWKMKREKGLISLLFKENQFVDLDNENVFSISSSIDFLFYDEVLFILSKKDFETGLNFREGMLAKADALYKEDQIINLFINLDVLINRVGDNQRYLKKIATIKNLGYYRDQQFLQNLKLVNDKKNWGIDFQGVQIVITEETLDDILTILQNKRLHSELSEEDFDVESVKKLEI